MTDSELLDVTVGTLETLVRTLHQIHDDMAREAKAAADREDANEDMRCGYALGLHRACTALGHAINWMNQRKRAIEAEMEVAEARRLDAVRTLVEDLSEGQSPITQEELDAVEAEWARDSQPIVVTPEAYEKIVELVKNPPAPSERLRRLMKGDDDVE